MPRQFASRKSKIKFRIAKIFILNMTIDNDNVGTLRQYKLSAYCLLNEVKRIL